MFGIGGAGTVLADGIAAMLTTPCSRIQPTDYATVYKADTEAPTIIMTICACCSCRRVRARTLEIANRSEGGARCSHVAFYVLHLLSMILIFTLSTFPHFIYSILDPMSLSSFDPHSLYTPGVQISPSTLVQTHLKTVAGIKQFAFNSPTYRGLDTIPTADEADTPIDHWYEVLACTIVDIPTILGRSQDYYLLAVVLPSKSTP